jgi:hypothetical protein
MWKLALKTNLYHMLENRRFETRVKLFFANFWNLAQVLKKWKKEKKKKNQVEYFKTFEYLDLAVIIKTRDPSNTNLDLNILSLTLTNYQILYAQWKSKRSKRPSLLEHYSPQQNAKTKNIQTKKHKSKKKLLSFLYICL